jgi:hypothetical protein
MSNLISSTFLRFENADAAKMYVDIRVDRFLDSVYSKKIENVDYDSVLSFMCLVSSLFRQS